MARLDSGSVRAVDFHDRLYMGDRRTKAVHVFDATGKRLGVCVPDAKDLSEISYVMHIAVSPAGEVFVLLSSKGSDSPYVRFGSDLTRKGTAHVDVDSMSHDWYFPPSGDLCWIKAYNDVFLVKGDVEQGFAAADVVLEMDTSHHNPTQGSLDPWCCVAQWQDGRLTIVSNSYAADQTRMHVSQMLELPIHKVRVVSEVAGSGGD